jgi:hypothetical protein
MVRNNMRGAASMRYDLPSLNTQPLYSGKYKNSPLMAAQYCKSDIHHISIDTLQDYMKDSLHQEIGKLQFHCIYKKKRIHNYSHAQCSRMYEKHKIHSFFTKTMVLEFPVQRE